MGEPDAGLQAQQRRECQCGSRGARQRGHHPDDQGECRSQGRYAPDAHALAALWTLPAIAHAGHDQGVDQDSLTHRLHQSARPYVSRAIQQQFPADAHPDGQCTL